jgi:hypothetical protein
LVNISRDAYIISSKGKDQTGIHEFGGEIGGNGDNSFDTDYYDNNYDYSITHQNGHFVQYLKSFSETVRRLEGEIESISRREDLLLLEDCS